MLKNRYFTLCGPKQLYDHQPIAKHETHEQLKLHRPFPKDVVVWHQPTMVTLNISYKIRYFMLYIPGYE